MVDRERGEWGTGNEDTGAEIHKTGGGEWQVWKKKDQVCLTRKVRSCQVRARDALIEIGQLHFLPCDDRDRKNDCGRGRYTRL